MGLLSGSLQCPKSQIGRLLLGSSLVQCIAVALLEAILGILVLPNIKYNDYTEKQRGIPVYIFIFVASQVWNVVLAWDATLRQNTFQLIGFVLFNLCTFLYAIFQLSQFKDVQALAAGNSIDISVLSRLLLTIPIVLGIFTIIFAYLAYKLYLEFGWNIYKKIGADPTMKKMFRAYQIFLTLLKIDLFFLVSFFAQFMILVLQKDDLELYATAAAIVLSIIIVVVAAIALQREIGKLMISFMVGLGCGIIYFVFKLYRIWTQDSKALANTRLFLTFFASISLLLFLTTVAISIRCYRNFGRGLKAHLYNCGVPQKGSFDSSYRQSMD